MQHRIRRVVVLYDIGDVKRFPVLVTLEVRDRPGTAALGCQVVFGGIDRDPVEPGIKGTIATKLRQGPVGLDKGLLGNLFCLGWVSNQAGDQPKDPALILDYQKLKRTLVAVLNPFDQLSVGLFLIDHPLRHPAPVALDAAKNQSAVGAPKAKVVFYRHINLQITGGVGAVIKVALGILVEDIDRGWALLMVDGQDRED